MQNLPGSARNSNNGTAPVLAGIIFAGLSLYAGYSSYRWLSRASTVLTTITPLPVFLTMRMVRDRYARPRAVAAIRPRDQAVAPFDAIDNIPLFTGLTSYSSPSGYHTFYVDAPAMAYLPQRSDYPMVFVVDGEYLCSRRPWVRR